MWEDHGEEMEWPSWLMCYRTKWNMEYAPERDRGRERESKNVPTAFLFFFVSWAELLACIGFHVYSIFGDCIFADVIS